MTDTSRPAAPTPDVSRPSTMLRTLLSHHEIATLLLLLHAPVDLSFTAKPELLLLEEAGLVEQMRSETGTPRFRLTRDGNALLQSLGVS